MIEIRDLTKKYKDRTVVDRVSTTIDKGKITSIIGPNGSGKSTVLSIISRLLDKDSGEVIIDGKKLEEWEDNELSKKISILTQFNNINIRLKVKELVAFGRFPHSKGRLSQEDKKYIDDALKYMKLESIKDSYLDHLSGGQRQRAYIAMILAQDTEYILLDEPLNNLDMKHSVEIMKILRRLVDELGKTIVIVIHDINFASKYSDKIIALKNGRIIEDGPTERVIDDKVLYNIYDLNFRVEDMSDMKFCMYY